MNDESREVTAPFYLHLFMVENYFVVVKAWTILSNFS